jgi:hypothetical protein
MRHLLLGSMLFAALAASSSAFAVEAGSVPGTDNAPPGKQVRTTKPKRTAVPLSAALDAHSTELPDATIHQRQPASPLQSSWTGIYVGVGAGVGQ